MVAKEAANFGHSPGSPVKIGTFIGGKAEIHESPRVSREIGASGGGSVVSVTREVEG